MRSSEQEGANVDGFWQEICQATNWCGRDSELRLSTRPSRCKKKKQLREAVEFNFPNVQYILDTLVGSLVTSEAKGNLLLQDENSEPLQKRRWKIASPIDSTLLNIHQANVHVFSDSVLSWERHNRQVYYKMETSSTTRRDDCLKSQFLDREFHVSPDATAMKLPEALNHHVSSTNDSIAKECTPRDVPNRIMFMDKMNELAITDKPH